MTEAKKRLEALHRIDHAEALRILVSEPWGKHKFRVTYRGVIGYFYSETLKPLRHEILNGLINSTGKRACIEEDIKCEWVPY